MNNICENAKADMREEALCGADLEQHLQKIFGGESVITTAQFKKVMQISDYELRKMNRLGTAPNIIPLTYGNDEGRYLIGEIARWIEKNRKINRFFFSICLPKKRGRGRPRKLSLSECEAAFGIMPAPAA